MAVPTNTPLPVPSLPANFTPVAGGVVGSFEKDGIRYQTRELPLGATAVAGMVQWRNLVIFNRVDFEAGTEAPAHARLLGYELDSGKTRTLLEAQARGIVLYVRQQVGDWLVYEEASSELVQGAGEERHFYALDLVSGEKRRLAVLENNLCAIGLAYQSVIGRANDGKGVVYLTGERSSGGCDGQIRYLDLTDLSDRLLYESKPGLSVDDPMISEGNLYFREATLVADPAAASNPNLPRQRLKSDVVRLNLGSGAKENLSQNGLATRVAVLGKWVLWVEKAGAGTAFEQRVETLVLYDTASGARRQLDDNYPAPRLYDPPVAGDGYFTWPIPDRKRTGLELYFPDKDARLVLDGPGGVPVVRYSQLSDRSFLWSWLESAASSRPGSAPQSRVTHFFLTTFD